MKYYFLFLAVSFTLTAFSQDIRVKLPAKYADHFDNSIEFHPDSTFKFLYRSHVRMSWSTGTWSVKNDTILFKVIPVYDIVKYKNDQGETVQYKRLSDDEIEDIIEMENSVFSLGLIIQNTQPVPDKLFFRRDKLLKVGEKGELITKKVYAPWRFKKFRPWYFKIDTN